MKSTVIINFSCQKKKAGPASDPTGGFTDIMVTAYWKNKMGNMLIFFLNEPFPGSTQTRTTWCHKTTRPISADLKQGT